MTNTYKKSGFVSRTTQIGSENYVYQIYVSPQAINLAKPPVIVFLHGIRERGMGGFISNFSPFKFLLEQYLSKIPAIVLLPQCRPNVYWSDAVMDEMVMQSLAETIAEFEADEQRVSLLGVSMGGYGAWHFAMNHPEKFAALVSICGGSPILTGDRFTPLAEKLKNTPAWLFHGADDRVVPVVESREIVKALEKAGNKPKYNEYPNVGHNVWMNALAESSLLSWILAQHR